jgi:outer membrane lipoprotein-sorting protein
VTGVLRRLPLSRLLLLCGVVLVVGIGATALALAIGTGPVPPPKPLEEAVHDALAAPHIDGVSARIQLTNHLLEGANLASGGGGEASQLSSSPLVSGASGRLWIGEGRARLELQSERGDTQILWDGKTAELYDASTNTLYRYTPPPSTSQGSDPGSSGPSEPAPSGTSDRQPPSVTKIREGIEHAEKHLQVSPAQPTDIAGQPAYTVRVSPREGGSLLGGAELSWDAVHGIPLRFAVYSTQSSAPVIELAATEISYGPVESSTLDFTPPADAKIQEVKAPTKSSSSSGGSATDGTGKPHVTTHGTGISSIVLVEEPLKPASSPSLPSQLQSLPKVDVNGTSASELQTELGTVLSFERSGVHYLMAGSVTPSAIEAFARSL